MENQSSNSTMTVRRIVKNGILLALMCAVGMFSIPLGENIKVSLQFFMLLLIFYFRDNLLDKLIISGLYLLIGLFLPVFAGFASGVSPTFGFVIGFVVSAIPFHFISKINKDSIFIQILACLAALLVVYIGGTLFFMFYLDRSFEVAVTVTVAPYVGIDFVKIFLVLFITREKRFVQYMNS